MSAGKRRPDEDTGGVPSAETPDLTKRSRLLAAAAPADQQQQQGQQQRYDAFLRWCRDAGADVSRVALRGNGPKGQGLFATQDIPAGEAYCAIPATLQVTCDRALDSNIGRAILACPVVAKPVSARSILYAWLIACAADEASFWHPWLAVCPAAYSDPLWWGRGAGRDEAAYLLAGTQAAHDVAFHQGRLDVMVAGLNLPALAAAHPRLFPAGRFTPARFLWARSFFSSRCYHIDALRQQLTPGGAGKPEPELMRRYVELVAAGSIADDCPAFCAPLMDMLNHDPGVTVRVGLVSTSTSAAAPAPAPAAKVEAAAGTASAGTDTGCAAAAVGSSGSGGGGSSSNNGVDSGGGGGGGGAAAGGDGMLGIAGNQAVAASSECFNNYGPRSNLQLLFGFGFCLEGNPNDEVPVKLGTPVAGPRQALLQAVGIVPGAVHMLRLRHPVIPPALLATLRVLAMAPELAQRLRREYVVGGGGGGSDGGGGGAGARNEELATLLLQPLAPQPEHVDLEQDALQALCNYVSGKLGQIDEGTLHDGWRSRLDPPGTISAARRTAWVYAQGQRTVLERALEELGSQSAAWAEQYPDSVLEAMDAAYEAGQR